MGFHCHVSSGKYFAVAAEIHAEIHGGFVVVLTKLRVSRILQLRVMTNVCGSLLSAELWQLDCGRSIDCVFMMITIN